MALWNATKMRINEHVPVGADRGLLKDKTTMFLSLILSPGDYCSSLVARGRDGLR